MNLKSILNLQILCGLKKLGSILKAIRRVASVTLPLPGKHRLLHGPSTAQHHNHFWISTLIDFFDKLRHLEEAAYHPVSPIKTQHRRLITMAPITQASDETNHQALLDKLDL